MFLTFPNVINVDTMPVTLVLFPYIIKAWEITNFSLWITGRCFTTGNHDMLSQNFIGISPSQMRKVIVSSIQGGCHHKKSFLYKLMGMHGLLTRTTAKRITKM